MAFTSQVILDNFRNYVVNVTGTAADASPGALLVDPSTLDPPCQNLRLKRVTYDISTAGSVQLVWDATTDVPFLNLSSGPGQGMDFCKFGGIPNNAGTGKTGSVLLIGTGVGLLYTLVLEFVKSDPVNKL